MSKKHFLKGTLILTCTGLISRMIGFFYRIFLSHSIGAQGLGLYQLIIPVQTLVLAVTTAGIQTVISRLVASHMALGRTKEARDCFYSRYGLRSFSLFCCFMDLIYQCRFFCRADSKRAAYIFSHTPSMLQSSLKHTAHMHQQLLFCTEKDRNSFRHPAF